MFTIKVFVGQGTEEEPIVIKIGKLISMIFFTYYAISKSLN